MAPPSKAPRLLTAAEACAILGVKRATLYSYVARTNVQKVLAADGTHRYVADDVERLAARSRARRGHGAVAAGALAWGEPVLDSAITKIAPDGPSYRGRPVAELIARRTSFEDVADLLWDAPPGREVWSKDHLDTTRQGAPSLWRLVQMTIARVATGEIARTDAEIRAQARALLVDFAGGGSSGTFAARVTAALRIDPALVRHVNDALILCADHELNASAFAARIAASAGAHLYAAIGAALCVFSGDGHGGSSERIARGLAADTKVPLAAHVRTRIAEGKTLRGFGHPLYPAGDPRARLILGALDAANRKIAGTKRVGYRRLRAYIEEVRTQSGVEPNLDVALLALTTAGRAPATAASVLFAIGRTAGWTAHVLEQKSSGALLRPRARYVGV